MPFKPPEFIPAHMGDLYMGHICLKCGALVPPFEWDGREGREIHRDFHARVDAASTLASHGPPEH